MKKIILLIILFVVLTGCTIKKLDNTIETNVQTILDLNLKLSNNSKNGYKYYLPKGVTVIDNTDYNEKLVANGTIYYLYIDIVSQHYQSPLQYKEDKTAYLSIPLKSGSKSGYLKVKKENKQYLVEMVYNYAKIKTYVEYKKLNDTIINCSYILSTLDYNDKIIDLLFTNYNFASTEEKFSLFKSSRENGNFLDYVEKYDKYVEEETQTSNITEDVKTNITE